MSTEALVPLPICPSTSVLEATPITPKESNALSGHIRAKLPCSLKG
jgi:hypothetical protein